MSAAQILFVLTAAVTLFSAVMVVSVRRMMHAALWLILALLGVAILFVLLQTGFFAIVQLLIYIGAIAILIIFAVMLTRQVMSEKTPQLNRGWVSGLAIAGGLMVILALVIRDFPASPVTVMGDPAAADVTHLGQALSDPNGFAIPFEVASILLVTALIGTIYIVLERKGGAK
ncbi:MAG: NADH-quinone oxidoreductase subunit J [Anaerolineaceae bacterium]|nr:NADH-quinone oxidoreductase subunit J [Anaerolineaceae bacterium]